MRGRVWVPRLPAGQTSERGVLVGGVGDDDERHFRPRLRRSFLGARLFRGGFLGGSALRARWRDAGAFALHLLKVRRPGSVAKSGGFVASGELEQLVERSHRLVHARVWISDSLE